MAYVPPNSTIKLLNVPLEPDYEITPYFLSINEQINYFDSKTVLTLTANSYVRKGRGIIKVQCTADAIYQCNYIMYRNTSYSGKWFYAFCNVEYINDNTAQITFKIDNIQTWLFDFTPEPCFVEREHTYTDVPGDNIIPENLETGEYIYSDETAYYPFWPENLKIVVAATFYWDETTQDWVDSACGMYGGIVNGCVYTYFDNTAAGAVALQDWLTRATNANKTKGIISVFICPLAIISQNGSATYSTTSWANRPGHLAGYQPRNKKLLTYPYCMLYVKTPTNAAEYRYEFFKHGQVGDYQYFQVRNAMSTNPSSMLIPVDYCTDFGYSNVANFNEAIELSGWPQITYNIDAYKAWLAQNGASLIVNGALSVGGIALAVAGGLKSNMVAEAIPATPAIPVYNSVTGNSWEIGGNPGSPAQYETSFQPNGAGLLGSIGGVANILAQIYQHSTLAPQSQGLSNANVNTNHGRTNFIFYNKCIRSDYARIIDDYFSRYGYACRQVKIPNMFARTRWTYVKTIGCHVSGNLPTEAISDIQACFNRGITFWVDVINYGNFTLTNDVRTNL